MQHTAVYPPATTDLTFAPGLFPWFIQTWIYETIQVPFVAPFKGNFRLTCP